MADSHIRPPWALSSQEDQSQAAAEAQALAAASVAHAAGAAGAMGAPPLQYAVTAMAQPPQPVAPAPMYGRAPPAAVQHPGAFGAPGQGVHQGAPWGSSAPQPPQQQQPQGIRGLQATAPAFQPGAGHHSIPLVPSLAMRNDSAPQQQTRGAYVRPPPRYQAVDLPQEQPSRYGGPALEQQQLQQGRAFEQASLTWQRPDALMNAPSAAGGGVYAPPPPPLAAQAAGMDPLVAGLQAQLDQLRALVAAGLAARGAQQPPGAADQERFHEPPPPHSGAPRPPVQRSYGMHEPDPNFGDALAPAARGPPRAGADDAMAPQFQGPGGGVVAGLRLNYSNAVVPIEERERERLRKEALRKEAELELVELELEQPRKRPPVRGRPPPPLFALHAPDADPAPHGRQPRGKARVAAPAQPRPKGNKGAERHGAATAALAAPVSRGFVARCNALGNRQSTANIMSTCRETLLPTNFLTSGTGDGDLAVALKRKMDAEHAHQDAEVANFTADYRNASGDRGALALLGVEWDRMMARRVQMAPRLSYAATLLREAARSDAPPITMSELAEAEKRIRLGGDVLAYWAMGKSEYRNLAPRVVALLGDDAALDDLLNRPNPEAVAAAAARTAAEADAELRRTLGNEDPNSLFGAVFTSGPATRLALAPPGGARQTAPPADRGAAKGLVLPPGALAPFSGAATGGADYVSALQTLDIDELHKVARLIRERRRQDADVLRGVESLLRAHGAAGGAGGGNGAGGSGPGGSRAPPPPLTGSDTGRPLPRPRQAPPLVPSDAENDAPPADDDSAGGAGAGEDVGAGGKRRDRCVTASRLRASVGSMN